MNRHRIIGLGVTTLFLFGPTLGFAAKFSNQFVEFELPPQWSCTLEGAEWVCQSSVEAKKRDAIIVLAAKLKGEQDSLDQYLAHLKSSKFFTSVQGKAMKSDPKYAKMVTLNTHPWVDSLHMDSEIPGFYTRYLATIKNDIGVLVTYSINKNKYQQYLKDFENMVNTLRVFRKPGGLNTGKDKSFLDTPIPKDIGNSTVFPVNPTGGSETPPPQKDELPLSWILIGVGVLGFYIWRKRRQSLD